MGTVPGVIAGSVIRVDLLPGAQVFDLVVGGVLLPLSIWLAGTNPPRGGDTGRLALAIPSPVLICMAALVGCVGGIYGIGGGSILSPLLIGSGRRGRGGGPGRAGLDVRDLGRGRGDVHDLVLARAGLGGSRLAPPGSPSASAAWPVAIPGPGSSPASPTG